MEQTFDAFISYTAQDRPADDRLAALDDTRPVSSRRSAFVGAGVDHLSEITLARQIAERRRREEIR